MIMSTPVLLCFYIQHRMHKSKVARLNRANENRASVASSPVVRCKITSASIRVFLDAVQIDIRIEYEGSASFGDNYTDDIVAFQIKEDSHVIDDLGKTQLECIPLKGQSKNLG